MTALAATASLAASPLTIAQDYEWEPGEGLHEEEWYDPSDWFDDEPYDDYGVSTVDYEHDDASYSAYWDGYYDGYYDDEFGIDYWDNEWSPAYSSAYTDGYYDGYYDSMQEYDYDLYYYVFTWAEPTERMDDRAERRGRRSEASRSDATKRQEAVRGVRAETRVRGTVGAIEKLPKSKYKNPAVYSIEWKNDGEAIADFGPKMKQVDMPFEKGDRVTIAGDAVERAGDRVIVVSSLTVGGKAYRLRTSSAVEKMSSK